MSSSGGARYDTGDMYTMLIYVSIPYNLAITIILESRLRSVASDCDSNSHPKNTIPIPEFGYGYPH